MALLLGAASSLLLARLVLGYPTAEWFRTTLVEMPYYHADSTGLPLPVSWKGVEYYRLKDKLIGMILTPGILLMALALYAATLHRAVECAGSTWARSGAGSSRSW